MKVLIKICFAFFFLLTLFVSAVIFFVNSPLNNSCQEQIFVVSKGQGFRTIGDNLEQEEIIRNSLVFKIHAVFSGNYDQLQAGNYSLSSCENINQIITKISRGETAQKRITIIEGWNLNEIADYLDGLEIVAKQDFLEKAKDGQRFKDEFSFLEDLPEKASLEGFLFPDTYSIPLDSDSLTIIRIFLSNFDKKMTSDLREGIKGNMFQIITKASLIEKEVRTYQDKELVSGIIDRRMAINMPLQIDATIAYITGKKTTRISIKETLIDSEYNTYLYRGLPVGPIANPGIESIKAAVFPKENNYLFYLSKPDGETVFSRNLEEHNIAKNEYLR
jgi:UPF0755 protein